MGTEYEIVQHDPSGQVLQVIRWEGPDRTVSSDEVDAHWEARMSRDANDSQRRRTQHMRDATPVSDEFPAHYYVLVDELDRVWVQEYRRPLAEGPNHWWVFDSDGSLVAHAETPVGLRVTTVSEAGMFCIERDSLDVEHVRVYRIETG